MSRILLALLLAAATATAASATQANVSLGCRLCSLVLGRLCGDQPGHPFLHWCHDTLPATVDADTNHCDTMPSPLSLVLSNSAFDPIDVRTCDKYDPVSGAPCVGNPLKPNAYKDCDHVVPAASLSTIVFNADTQYISFVNGNKELNELWPTNGKWPTSYTVRPTRAESKSDVESAWIDTSVDTTTKHHVQPTASHCEDIVAEIWPNGNWWKANGWKYDSWTAGRCPSTYNYVNEVDHPVEHVTHRTLGVALSLVGECQVQDNNGSCSLHRDDGNHCYQLTVSGDSECYQEFWAKHGEQYAQFEAGACDSKYNLVNKEHSVCTDVMTYYKGIQ